jgi:hypothetical protein
MARWLEFAKEHGAAYGSAEVGLNADLATASCDQSGREL